MTATFWSAAALCHFSLYLAKVKLMNRISAPLPRKSVSKI